MGAAAGLCRPAAAQQHHLHQRAQHGDRQQYDQQRHHPDCSRTNHDATVCGRGCGTCVGRSGARRPRSRAGSDAGRRDGWSGVASVGRRTRKRHAWRHPAGNRSAWDRRACCRRGGSTSSCRHFGSRTRRGRAAPARATAAGSQGSTTPAVCARRDDKSTGRTAGDRSPWSATNAGNSRHRGRSARNSRCRPGARPSGPGS